jgi:O-antigen/teichoic acid export membrane protein
MPLLLLAIFYDAREVGWYALMLRVAMAPMSVFTGALGSSFWAHAAEHARAGRFAQLAADYRRTTGRLALAAVPVALACLAGPFVVGPILGEAEWSGAGWVLLAMTPLFLGALVFSPTNHLVVLGRQRLQLLADTLRLAGGALAIWIAHQLELEFVVAVAAASTASCLGHAAVFAIHLGIQRGNVE